MSCESIRIPPPDQVAWTARSALSIMTSTACRRSARGMAVPCGFWAICIMRCASIHWRSAASGESGGRGSLRCWTSSASGCISRFRAQVQRPRGALGMRNMVRRVHSGAGLSRGSPSTVTRSGGGTVSRASLRAIQSSPSNCTPHRTRWPSRCRQSWLLHAPKPPRSAWSASRSRWPSAIAGSRGGSAWCRGRRWRHGCVQGLRNGGVTGRGEFVQCPRHHRGVGARQA